MFPGVDITVCSFDIMLSGQCNIWDTKQARCWVQNLFRMSECLKPLKLCFKPFSTHMLFYFLVSAKEGSNSTVQYFSFWGEDSHCSPLCYEKNCGRETSKQFFQKFAGALLCTGALVTPLSVTIYHWDIFSSVDKRYIPCLICRASAAQPSWMLMWMQPSFCT